ncbi:hypothetical protein JRI60_01500 [Archangium violaceum]|uniref:hypothetical protein n=1 Tax=Archangium violaceum TaxID=83451 RepID=UPI00194F580A|nr:hypothetical protein [Archangium violaceum]QRN97789.1 hypothetical protein JRI60_01500 [Archangium violaceum]
MSKEVKADYAALRQKLLYECESMVEFVATSGRTIPQEAVRRLQTALAADGQAMDLTDIAAMHEQLAKCVSPATPRGISVIRESANDRFRFLGSVPLVRRLMQTGILCLVAFISISLSPHIGSSDESLAVTPQVNATHAPEAHAEGAQTQEEQTGVAQQAQAQEGQKGGAQLSARRPRDLLDGEGVGLLINELFLLAAAGLGACFAALFEVESRIVQRNFDPDSEGSYWIRFLLGVISGFILVTLVPIPQDAAFSFGRPLMAMLGGFSGSAVHRILLRLVETIESLVKGSTQEVITAQEHAIKARAAGELLQQRTKLAMSIMRFRKDVSGEATAEQVDALLDQLLGSLVEPEGAEARGSTRPARNVSRVLANNLVNAPAPEASEPAPGVESTPGGEAPARKSPTETGVPG